MTNRSQRGRAVLVVVVVLALWNCTAGPTAPLTVAASGVAASKVLDTLAEKATQIVQQAAAAGSLLSTKAARDLELEVVAARQQLHDELNQNWDRLDQEKVAGLRGLDTAMESLSANIQKVGNITDDLSLDVDQKLAAIPFLKNVKTIRRVEGASQYFRTEGLYVVRVKGNLFDQLTAAPVVTVDGTTLEPTSVLLKPPYDLVLNIKAEMINRKFKDRTLSYLPIVIRQQVANRPYSFQVWKDQYRNAEYTFKLELFPQYPAAYLLTEWDEEPIVDASRTETAAARFMYVPGCGNSGCNAYYNVCTDVPAGGKPLEAVDFRDSFSGWGGFGAPWITSTGMCSQYWQHSHNVGRNVGFSVRYNPLGSHIIPHPLALVALSSDQKDALKTQDAAQTPTSLLGLNVFLSVVSSQVADLVGVRPQAPTSLRIVPITAPSATPGTMLVVDHGGVRLGRTYSARFSPNMKSFDLVFRTFTGEELVVTPAKSSKLVDASPLELDNSFKRMTVSLKTPW